LQTVRLIEKALTTAMLYIIDAILFWYINPNNYSFPSPTWIYVIFYIIIVIIALDGTLLIWLPRPEGEKRLAEIRGIEHP
jgi:hypothetical protein